MTDSDSSAFARSAFYHPDNGVSTSKDGMTKREYFAAHTDIPWNEVLITLNNKFPEKKGRFTVLEVLEYQAAAKVQAADLLIEALNKQP
jgi:hypothetical protein